MINNISGADSQIYRNIGKITQSRFAMQMAPILGFKTAVTKEKAKLRYTKFSRRQNLQIVHNIEDDYLDIVEEFDDELNQYSSTNFIKPIRTKVRKKYLKDCYVLDYIESPKQRCGLGTEALKGLAEKAMFDNRAEGRIVTFSAPIHQESSPALFFYKLGFRFFEPAANEYMEECLIKKVPDLPPQTGMMYLPKANLHRLLRYGDLF